MSALDLYDPTILSRARRPVGAGALAGPLRRGRAENKVCGDEIEVDVRDANGVVEAVAHRGRGCAIMRASASLLAETVHGIALAEAAARLELLRASIAGATELPAALAALAPVRTFPARARCALLPWEALAAAAGAAPR